MAYTNKNFTWDFDALKRFYEKYIVKWLNSAVSWTDAQKKQARANLGFGNGDVDDEPTAGSDNLVKSGGIKNELVENSILEYEKVPLDNNHPYYESALSDAYMFNGTIRRNQYTSRNSIVLFRVPSGVYKLCTSTPAGSGVGGVFGTLDSIEDFIIGGNVNILINGDGTEQTKFVTFYEETLLVFLSHITNYYQNGIGYKMVPLSVKEELAKCVHSVDYFEKVANQVEDTIDENKDADLSNINNIGYIQSNLSINTNNRTWIYGAIPLQYNITKSIKFNNLPAAQYSSGVFSYFIDKNNSYIENSKFAGNTYLGAGIVTIDVPVGAVALLFTGVVADLPEYDITLYNSNIALTTQTQQNTVDITDLQRDVYGYSADLSSVTNIGYIKQNHQIEQYKLWRYGNIPIPSKYKTITFNNLPSAQYSSGVYSYFVNENNEFIGDNLTGASYLGAGVVTIDIPNGATGLMFTGATADLLDYEILLDGLINNETEKQSIDILIPDVIYVIVGTELNIWNDAVSLSVDNGLYSPRNYVVEWNCNKGLITSRGFRFTPINTEVGVYPLICSIFDSNTHRLIATKNTSIKVVAKDALNAQKRIVHFGDSLGANTVSKLYEDFNNSDKFAGVAPIMLGTRGTNPNYHFEAVGGYGWKSYATEGNNQYRIQVTDVTSVNVGSVYSFDSTNYNIREVNITDGTGNLLLEREYGVAGSIDGVVSGTITYVSGSGDSSINFTNCVREPNNPLWDESLNSGNGGLNFAKYRERLGLLSSEKIDAVSFQFGVNESLSGVPDLNSILENYIIPLYNAFVADNPSGKFIVGMTTSAGNDVNGAGINYGAARNTWQYLVNTYNFRKMYLERLQNQYTNLIIAPSQLELDRYYGYGFSSRQISQRTVATEQYHNNYVHPGNDGYGQLADALFATYIGALTDN